MEAADVGPLLPGAQDGDETLPVGLPACDICDKTFKTNSDVRKHRKIHFDGKFQCSHCGREQESQHHVHGDDGRQKEEETEVNVNEYYISLDLA